MVEQAPEDHLLQGSRLVFAFIEQPNDEGGSVAMLENHGLQFFGGRVPLAGTPAEALGRMLSYQIINITVPAGASRPLWQGRYNFRYESAMPELSQPARIVPEHVSVFSISLVSTERPPEARIGITRLVPKDMKVINSLQEDMYPFAYDFLARHLRIRDEGLSKHEEKKKWR